MFAFVLIQAVGIADLILDDSCEETCRDDGCTDCLPGVACRCHSPTAMPILGGAVHAAARLIAPREITPASVVQRRHASPDPREILHVPKHVG